MSETTQSIQLEDQDRPGELPRAIIHKQILDVAKSSPDASLEEIADKVSGASVELVERVLEDYGDPADIKEGTGGEQPSEQDEDNGSSIPVSGNSETPKSEESGAGENPDPGLVNLTPKQRRTLQAIAGNPHASQAEIAEDLGVVAATVCRRVNSIKGFHWDERREFVNRLVEEGELAPRPNQNTTQPENHGHDKESPDIDELTSRVEVLESELRKGREGTESPRMDFDLASRVIRACIESSEISKSEEPSVIQLVLFGETRSYKNRLTDK